MYPLRSIVEEEEEGKLFPAHAYIIPCTQNDTSPGVLICTYIRMHACMHVPAMMTDPYLHIAPAS